MRLDHYRKPFDDLPAPEHFDWLADNAKQQYDAAFSLALEYAKELERWDLLANVLECHCGMAVSTMDELDAGKCVRCQRDDNCEVCGDDAVGSCPACAM